MKRRIKRLFYANRTKVTIYLIIVLLLMISFFFFSFAILKLNGIETVFRTIILFLGFLYLFFYIYKGYIYIINRKKIKYCILIIVTFIISIILFILTFFINTLYGELSNLTESDISTYTGYLISLKDTNKKDIEVVGIISDEDDTEGYKIAKEVIKDNNLEYNFITYDTYEEMIYDLYNKEIEAAFVQSNYVMYFEEIDEYKNIKDDTKIIFKKTIEKKNNNKLSVSNKTLKEPFTVLLMGVDSTIDNIETSSAFNGDTLMLITFNPKTLNATIFSIPRDLYVPISCRKGNSAKINSSSVGGVSCVKKTIEDLIDIKIDYYAKINFKGVVDLVEALDGIDVEVTYPFCEQDSNRDFTNQICLKAGYQHLNGEETLAFARHRHSLPTGDLTRIQNQQLIVEAMSRRLISLNTVTDFKDILSAISNNIVTNMSVDQILSSYDILKSMVINVISDKDALIVEKAYLEVYDMSVYNEKTNSYSQTLGYYENSLEDIENAMKINLELNDAKHIKTFLFDANTPYEQKVIGKGLRNNVNSASIKDFTGSSVSTAEEWGKENNITIKKEYVTMEDSKYNDNVSVGLIGSQSIKAGTSLSNISALTIYINTVLE